MITIGIDPGKRGCIAKAWGDEAEAYPIFGRSIPEVVNEVMGSRYYRDWRIGVELVSSRPNDDPYSAFQFGKNVGKLLGVLDYLGLKYEEVSPQTWQREFGLGGKYKDQPTRKRAHKQKAQELFPDIKVTLDTCDAILIAEYMWRKTFGELTNGKDANYITRSGSGVVRTTRSLSDV